MGKAPLKSHCASELCNVVPLARYWRKWTAPLVNLPYREKSAAHCAPLLLA